MTARRGRRYWLAAAAVLVAAATVATYELARGTGEAGGAPERVAVATAMQGNRGAAIAAPQSPALAAAPRVDVARVEAALARMKASAARISREQVLEEQKRLAAAKARFEAIKVPEPTKRSFTDKNGTRWVELRYESGELRYELAPEPESPQSDAAR